MYDCILFRVQTVSLLMQKKTLVLGASPNPERYSYLAAERLQSYGHPVIAVGKKQGRIGQVNIEYPIPALTDIHTVTIYLNSKNQEAFYDSILALHPVRIIFNPGAENDMLKQLAAGNQIETIEACTLVMLSTGQY